MTFRTYEGLIQQIALTVQHVFILCLIASKPRHEGIWILSWQKKSDSNEKQVERKCCRVFRIFSCRMSCVCKQCGTEQLLCYFSGAIYASFGLRASWASVSFAPKIISWSLPQGTITAAAAAAGGNMSWIDASTGQTPVNDSALRTWWKISISEWCSTFPPRRRCSADCVPKVRKKPKHRTHRHSSHRDRNQTVHLCFQT